MATVVCSSVNKLFRGENRNLAAAIIEKADELESYWPLTLRQLYYRLVAGAVISNDQTEYRRVSKVTSDLRRGDMLNWNCLEDRTRTVSGKRGFQDADEFIRMEISGMFAGYTRCYLQQQSVYAEILVEKDALRGIVENAAWGYCTRVLTCRGHLSTSMTKGLADRMGQSIGRDQQPVILYFGDLDPSGIAIPKAIVRNLQKHHGIDADLRRIALNPTQVAAYSLPEGIDEAKEQDPNYGAWLKEFGPDMKPCELDAMHPETLTDLVKETLAGTYDQDLMDEEREREQRELVMLAALRGDVRTYAMRRFGEMRMAA